MKKNSLVFALVLAATVAFAYAGIGQQKADDTATDPVCGMKIKKAEAKATFEYEGKTYYFCSAGCKETFAENPEKYAAKTAPEPSQPTAMGMHHHGQMMSPGQASARADADAMECPLLAKDVEMTVENLPDGVDLKFTSKNPETVKKIQEHLAEMKSGCPGCPAHSHQEPGKK